jgi:uncharacterized protein YjeT (DUF2065 family)
MASEIELATGVVLFVFGLSFVLNPGYWGPAFKKMMTESQQTFVLFLVVLVGRRLARARHRHRLGRPSKERHRPALSEPPGQLREVERAESCFLDASRWSPLVRRRRGRDLLQLSLRLPGHFF